MPSLCNRCVSLKRHPVFGRVLLGQLCCRYHCRYIRCPLSQKRATTIITARWPCVKVLTTLIAPYSVLCLLHLFYGATGCLLVFKVTPGLLVGHYFMGVEPLDSFRVRAWGWAAISTKRASNSFSLNCNVLPPESALATSNSIA